MICGSVRWSPLGQYWVMYGDKYTNIFLWALAMRDAWSIELEKKPISEQQQKCVGRWNFARFVLSDNLMEQFISLNEID